MSSLHYQLFLFFCFYVAVQAPYRDSDIMLGGLFNVHQPPDQPGRQCGEIYLTGLGGMQAMIFAIERINNDTSLLSNISLGYDIRDYCGNLSKAARLVYKLLTVNSCVNLSQNATKKKAIVSLIGPKESSTALFIAGFLRMLNVSSISGSATSAELSSLTYDHLFRTVPSDTFLAKAMVDLVTHFNWSYVAVVALDDSYGRNGAWAVVSESTSRKSSFCIALTQFVRHESLNLSISKIVRKLKQMHNVKVVILWLYKNYRTKFLAEVQKQNLTGRVWIFSSAPLTSTLPIEGILESSLGFQLHEFSDFGFKEYLKDILVRGRDNRSFSEWNYSTSEIWKLLRSKKCVHRQIEQCSNNLITESYSSYVPYIIDAVYAVAHAVDIFNRNFSHNETKDRAKLQIANSFEVQKLLGRVNFDGLTGKIKFDRFGNRGSAYYDIFSTVPNGDVESVKMVLIGEWKNSKRNETRLIFHEALNWTTKSGRPPKSECSEQCPPGTRKSFTSPCCWQCLPCLGGTISPSAGSESCSECPIGKISNQAKTECVALPSANLNYGSASGILILTFATLGVLVTLLCLATLYKFWNSPIVKASNRELNLVLLLTILSLLSLVFINIFISTNPNCMIIYPLRYLTYNFCLSVLLVKVLRISSAFRVPIMTSLEFTSLPNKAQVGIVIASLAPLLSVLMPWLLLDPPFNMQHIYPKRYTFNECKAYSSSLGKSLFLVTCFYIFFQMLLSTFCAFKIRNIPENFNEAKQIAFSMYIFLFSLLCYHPVELSLDGWYVTVVDCVTTLLSAYGFLCCLFLPKMYILFFRQEMNDANGIRQEVTQFSVSSGCERVNPAFDSSN
ncbi:metabotropic glutamate receptor 4-like [Pocillopora verrucosa]|uniref:metabotropic glutamate receptor 4-like n=1 Tax=Pocillopora verrucosa TaxID=203993 RepID=UPI00333ED992